VLLKLLHTADWHLGREFLSFSEDGRLALARARLAVLDHVFAEAERNDVHAVLCSGNLFSDPSPKREWWEGLATKLAAKNWSRPVFLVPGTHDPLMAEGVWRDARFLNLLPDFVHVVDRELAEHSFGAGAVLYATPGDGEAIPPRAKNDSRTRVGVTGRPGFGGEERGLDYLASQPAPEPFAFDEPEQGFVSLVMINSQRRVTLDRRRVGQWSWETVRVTDLATLRALASRSDLADRVLRVTVEMRVSASEYEEAEHLLEELGGTEKRHAKAGVLELNRDGLTLDVSNVGPELATLPAVLQATVRRLQVLAADPVTRAAAERALFHLFRTARGAR